MGAAKGEAAEKAKPLAGIRALDLTQAVGGEFQIKPQQASETTHDNAPASHTAPALQAPAPHHHPARQA